MVLMRVAERMCKDCARRDTSNERIERPVRFPVEAEFFERHRKKNKRFNAEDLCGARGFFFPKGGLFRHGRRDTGDNFSPASGELFCRSAHADFNVVRMSAEKKDWFFGHSRTMNITEEYIICAA